MIAVLGRRDLAHPTEGAVPSMHYSRKSLRRGAPSSGSRSGFRDHPDGVSPVTAVDTSACRRPPRMERPAMRTSDAVELVVLAAIWGASFLFMRIAAPEARAGVRDGRGAARAPGAPRRRRSSRPATRRSTSPARSSRVADYLFAYIGVLVVIGSAPSRSWRSASASPHRSSWRRWRCAAGSRRCGGGSSTWSSWAPSTPPCRSASSAYATLSMTAGLTSILNATSPLWGALVAHLWLKDRLTRSRTLGLAIGFAGLAFLVWGRASFKARRQRARRRRGAGGDALVRSGRELHPAVPARRRSPRRGGGQPARGDRPAPPGALALWPAHPVRVSTDRERQDRRIVNSRIESS